MSSIGIYFLLIPNALVCIATSAIMISDTPEGVYLFTLLGCFTIAIGNLWFGRRHIPIFKRSVPVPGQSDWSQARRNLVQAAKTEMGSGYNQRTRGSRFAAQDSFLIRSGSESTFAKDVVMSRRRLTYDVAGKNPTLH